MVTTSRDILAFVHVEKSAGSSFKYCLRYNFPLAHCEVKPLSNDSSRVFSSCDMQKILKINPWVKSISGHSVAPYSDLRETCPNIKYVTVIRNPIKRYVSQYLYWIDEVGWKGDFPKFLNVESRQNFQVKKIAGVADIGLAKKYIDEEFFLVGLTEDFAEFILRLSRKLKKNQFKPVVYHLNIGEKASSRSNFIENIEQYLPAIKERNVLDIELYNYVKNKLAHEKSNFDSSFFLELESLKKNLKLNNYRRQVNRLYRKLYYEPLIAFLRVRSGREIRGGY